MLYSLSGRNQPRVAHSPIHPPLQQVIGVGNDAGQPLCGRASRPGADGAEHTLEPVHVDVRFERVRLEGLVQLRIGHLSSHSMERWHELPLALEQFVERVYQKRVE